MRARNLALSFVAAVAVAIAAAGVSAQNTNPRFGVWKLKSDAPPPASNVMTYEPYGEDGMQVTVESTSSRGEHTKWSYVTRFDGVFRPVTGQENAETSVEYVEGWTTRIANKRNGRVAQVIINMLSEDRKTINNEYVRFDESGKITGVSHAVYERIR